MPDSARAVSDRVQAVTQAGCRVWQQWRTAARARVRLESGKSVTVSRRRVREWAWGLRKANTNSVAVPTLANLLEKTNLNSRVGELPPSFLFFSVTGRQPRVS